MEYLWNMVEKVSKSECPIECRLGILNYCVKQMEKISVTEADALSEWIATSIIGG